MIALGADRSFHADSVDTAAPKATILKVKVRKRKAAITFSGSDPAPGEPAAQLQVQARRQAVQALPLTAHVPQALALTSSVAYPSCLVGGGGCLIV